MITIRDLVADPANRRKHNPRNLGMIADALRDVGAARSVVLDENNVLLAGNGVTAAATAAGISKVRIIDADGDELIAVRRSGLSDDQKRRLAMYDNRTAELAEWNTEQLKADLAAGLDLVPFFEPGELEELLAEQPAAAPVVDDIPIPEERATDIVRGDVFALGDHRLICGDCTNRQDLERLLGSDRVSLCFTSPPYAQQREDQYGGTDETAYVEWFATVQAAIRPRLLPSGHFVVNIKPHAREKQRSLYVLDLVAWMVRSGGWIFVDEFCWLRTGIPQQAVNRFKNAFEPCYWFANSEGYVWYPDAVRHASDEVPIPLGKGSGKGTTAAESQGKGGGIVPNNPTAPGLAYPSNVLDLRHNAEAIGHPAAFPIHLPAFFLGCLSAPGDNVLDPFAGSGSTLMACEVNQRRSFAIELQPTYCQIIVDRWEAYTKRTATRLERSHDDDPRS